METFHSQYLAADILLCSSGVLMERNNIGRVQTVTLPDKTEAD